MLLLGMPRVRREVGFDERRKHSKEGGGIIKKVCEGTGECQVLSVRKEGSRRRGNVLQLCIVKRSSDMRNED